MNNAKSYKMQDWYKQLKKYCFPAEFLPLNAEELKAMKQKDASNEILHGLQKKLTKVMSRFSGYRFVSTDTVSPTDTVRFREKRGAVSSAKSALKILLESAKVQQALEADEVTSICVRPFRRMQPAREFRLFIKDGKLAAMSQYWLIRHFRRLPDRQERYWDAAEKFVRKHIADFPETTIVMDIYFTSAGEIMIVDFNPWGSPTDPLMFNDWERDWNTPSGCVIVPPPHTVSGDINVRF